LLRLRLLRQLLLKIESKLQWYQLGQEIFLALALVLSALRRSFQT
jgi:hypothetical protein